MSWRLSYALVQTSSKSRSEVLESNSTFYFAEVVRMSGLREDGKSNGWPTGGPDCQPFRPTKRVGKEDTTNLFLSDMLFVLRSKALLVTVLCAHTGVKGLKLIEI